MALSEEKINAMDKIYSLSDEKMAQMDDIVGYDNLGDNYINQKLNTYKEYDDFLNKEKEDLKNNYNIDVDKENKKKNNFLSDVGQGFVKGLSNLPVAIGKNFTNPVLRPLIGKEPLTDEELMQGYGWMAEKPTNATQHVASFVGENAPYFLVPEIKVAQGAKFLPKAGATLGNGAILGGLAGGSESLQQKGDLSGVVPGMFGGAAVNATVNPLVNAGMKAIPFAKNWYLSKAAGLKPETLKTVVKPNSKALDLSEDEAKLLLTNTTERVKKDYNDLLNAKGQEIGEIAQSLNDSGLQVKGSDLLDDVTNLFNSYQRDKVNNARKFAGDLEEELADTLMSAVDENGMISPVSLNALKEQVGKMVGNWDKGTPKNTQMYKDNALRRLYGAWNDRLSKLSPSLAKANKEYADLINFKKNEGLERVLKNDNKIDQAGSALRNYNANMSKGNTNRNVQDLENLFIKNGKEGFLNDIDDVNAVGNLLNSPLTGYNSQANVDYKKLLARPLLRAERFINGTPIPQMINKIGVSAKPLFNRMLPVMAGKTAPLLYGGVEYNDYGEDL
jgi:hypothetical protein